MSGAPAPPIVVMGAAGAGKSTVGRALAQRLGAEFVDADDRHPPANRAKMARGEPLDDTDRAPWLAALHELLAQSVASGRRVVLACSALKATYREVLLADVPRGSYLRADGRCSRRLASRRLHFSRPRCSTASSRRSKSSRTRAG
jgi:gluconokinase